MKIMLLRHGKTLGNEKKRYIGRTDEALSQKGKLELLDTRGKLESILGKEVQNQWRNQNSFFKIYMVVSPMLRCRETAKEVFLGFLPKEEQKVFIPFGIKEAEVNIEIKIVIEEELKECDFGIFENKNYLELSKKPQYQQWIDSNGTMDFPGGESLSHFKERSVTSFQKHIKTAWENQADMVLFVVHGGNIMAILEAMDSRQLGYYDYSVKNGAFVFGEVRGEGYFVSS